MQYIGETVRRVRDTLYEHIYSIRVSKISTPVAEHFRLPGHSQQDLKLQVIERCPDLTSEAQNHNMVNNFKYENLAFLQIWW
jgi:hypothetical protein